MMVVGGESLIDLVQEKPGADGAIRLTAHPGGSPYNCAIALSRLGRDAGFLSPISRDSFGDHLLGPLTEAGVRPLLPLRVDAPTTLAVVTLNNRMEAQYEFYRGADRAFTREGLLEALPAKPELFQIGGFCAIEAADADIWLEVADTALDRGATLSMDPNVRPSLVEDFSAYAARLDRFFDLVHIAKLSIEDLIALETGRSAPTVSASERDAIVEKWTGDLLGRRNCELVVVTFGEGGSRACTRSGTATAEVWRPPVFGDTVGAGDSLMAGVLTALAETGDLRPDRVASLDAAALSAMLRFGAVVAGLNCAHRGCNPPTRTQVQQALSSTS